MHDDSKQPVAWETNGISPTKDPALVETWRGLGWDVRPLYAAPQDSEAVRNVNAAMAAEYQRWIDYYHQGRDYDDFLKECVHNRAALSAQPAAQKGASDA